MNQTVWNLKELSLVLIADRTYKKGDDTDIDGNQLEMISEEYYEDIFAGLSKICKQVIHYQSPEQLINNIQAHQNDLVMTIYGGAGSRNRMALVPAICEAYQVKFVGADTYARIICQDKYLSKEFARRFNVNTVPGILVDKELNPFLVKELSLPLIIKPNFEGSSIGINEKSKVYTYEEAITNVNELIQKFKQSVIIEEFIEGKEICLCIVGSNEVLKMFRAMEVYAKNDDTFLINNVYSAYEKHISERIYSHRDITEKIPITQQESLKKLFYALGKMDFMRIDGRVNSNGFHLIELTPDAYIGRKSALSDAADVGGLSYEQLLETIIHTALAGYHTPYSNYTES